MSHALPRGAVSLMAIALASCASTPDAPPKFDPQASIDAQINTFVTTEKLTPKRLAGTGKLAITGCNVLFATYSSASASTSGGLFGEVGNTKRVEAKVSQFYTLAGLSDADMQAMADRICANAETKLTAAGFSVVPHVAIQADPNFQPLAASGRATPFSHKLGTGKGGTAQKYQVFTRTGETIHSASYLGTVGGLAQAFKAAGGNSSWQNETRLMQSLGASAVHLDVLVDFASPESSGHASATQIGQTNSASVDVDVRLAAAGRMDIMPLSELKCWERFGKNECNPIHEPARVLSKLAVAQEATFYEKIEDTTTTTDALVSGFTKVMGAITLLGGQGGSQKVDITRYTVTVTPQKYGEMAELASDQFVTMATRLAKREGGL